MGARFDQSDAVHPRFAKLGLTFDAPAVRMARFREAVAIVKGYFTAEKSVSFIGKH